MASWRAYHGEIEKLCQQQKITFERLTDLADCSLSTIRNARNGEPVSDPVFRSIACALDVPPERLGKQDLIRRDDTALASLVGLFDEPPRAGNDDVPFQDFDLFGSEFNNPIQHLWAHPLGSTISAQVLTEDDERFLRITFDNKPGSHPGNVLLHPQGLFPRECMPSQRYLTFDIRDHSDTDDESPGGSMLPTLLAIRVRDAKLEQWEFRTRAGYCLPPVSGPDWQRCVVDLRFDRTQPNWQRFEPISHDINTAPDFRVLTALGFELGRGPSRHRPGTGQGTVDIKNIYLRSEVDG